METASGRPLLCLVLASFSALRVSRCLRRIPARVNRGWGGQLELIHRVRHDLRHREITESQTDAPHRGRLCASSSANGGHFGLAWWLGGVGFLMLLEIVHVEVSVGFEPVLVGFDGEGSDEAAAGVSWGRCAGRRFAV
jgi:hypothetical protein